MRTRQCTLTPAPRRLNVAKAAVRLLLQGEAGRRSGTAQTRATNADLEALLGLYREQTVRIPASGSYGNGGVLVHRKISATEDATLWEEAARRLGV